ncbi:MAG: UvrD-helicase domain-containing protein [Rickettsiales bacterium]|nr:UvrD-helicase domain-containing protein [Rickettsiales bacterium]
MQKTIKNTQKNIWVSASAGSGKTKVLIDRFITLLLEGVDPRKIVCITFTKSAATEMLERINKTLGFWSICTNHELKNQLTELLGTTPTPDIESRARILLPILLDAQHNLQIKTIHSFCQTILSKFPIESGIEINSQILEGSDLEKIQTLAQKHTITTYQNYSFAQDIDYLLSNIHDIKLSEIFAHHLFITSQHPDFFTNIQTLDKKIQNLYQKFNIPQNFNIVAEEEKLKYTIMKLIHGNKHILSTEADILKSLLTFKSTDNLSKLSPYFLTNLGLPRKQLITKKYSSNELLELLEKIQNMLVGLEHKKIATTTTKQTAGFLFLGHVFLNTYTKIKKQHQCLDYNDLLHHTIKLLNTKALATWIQYKLHHKITHLLIDEAQDTNLLQWEIIEQITQIFFQYNNEKECTIFVVGDPKQSIYSFQGTSPEIFELMKNFNINSNKNWIECQLNTSYRSDKIILDFIDEVFNTITKSSPELFYTNALKHISSVNFNEASIEILPVIFGHKQDTEDHAWEALIDYPNSNYDPSQILAKILARKIQSLLLTDKHQPSDFLILIRKRDKLTKNIIKEFKKLGIPISGMDRIHLNSSLAIQDLMSLVNFILLPQDNYNLACLLKSPFLSVSEEVLATLAKDKESSIWDNLKNQREYHHLYKTLSQLMEIGLTSRPFEFFVEILDVLSYRKNFIEYFGHQINEVLDEFLNICQIFQKTDTSLVNFVQWFNNSSLEIKRDITSKKDQVRIMTVHASKGLQAKYVILPDTTNVPSNKNPIIFDQKEELLVYKTEPLQNISEYFNALIEKTNTETLKEYFRLLYVALTRAKQHILVCGWTNIQSINPNSWFSKLNNVLAKKDKLEAKTIMGFNNINLDVAITNDQKDFFISNNQNIYYLQKSTNQENNNEDNAHQEDIDIQIPEFLQVPVKNNCSTSLTPSNTSQQDTIENYKTTIGTILHKALEVFVIQKNVSYDLLEKYIQQTSVDKNDHTFYIDSLLEVINNIILPKTTDAFIKKETKIYKKLSKNMEISAKIDLLIITPEQVTIVDYKTSLDSNIPESIYQQLALYVYIISEVYPNKKITCSIISILTKKMFDLPIEKLELALESLRTKFAKHL